MAVTENTPSIEEECPTQRKVSDAQVKYPSFPYKPYSIQIDFMDALYESLNRGGISMLESPTGTGKTLSVICSALQWIIDQRKKNRFEIESDSKNDQTSGGLDEEPDWLKSFSVGSNDKVMKMEKSKKMIEFASARLNRKKENGIGCNLLTKYENQCDIDITKGCGNLKRKDVVETVDDDFLLEDYETDEEVGNAGLKRKVGVHFDSSSTDEEECDKFDADEEEEEMLKVYFCSRTHSQLSQFVKELRKTNFIDELNMVCLGSRKNFCINEGMV